jgi:hypothetical protein
MDSALATDAAFSRCIPLQVKYSRDYSSPAINTPFDKELSAFGWYSLDASKIKNSRAKYWVFVVFGQDGRKEFVIIPPKTLFERLTQLRGGSKRMNCYLAVTKGKKCWETRNLRKDELSKIAAGSYYDALRDFTKFLNNWEEIEAL